MTDSNTTPNAATGAAAERNLPIYYHQPSGNIIHRVNFITHTSILAVHVAAYTMTLAQLLSTGNPLDFEDLDSKWARLVEEAEGFLGKTVVCDHCEMAHSQEQRLQEAMEILVSFSCFWVFGRMENANSLGVSGVYGDLRWSCFTTGASVCPV